MWHFTIITIFRSDNGLTGEVVYCGIWNQVYKEPSAFIAKLEVGITWAQFHEATKRRILSFNFLCNFHFIALQAVYPSGA